MTIKKISKNIKQKTMEREIRRQLALKKIREMKNPNILINTEDFEEFKKSVESKVIGLKFGLYPTYEGIPIKGSDFIDRYTITIVDYKQPNIYPPELLTK
jgi:hypothetical protein